MILRCWLVVWVKWARPLVSMTLWSRVMFNWKRFNWKDGPFMGRPTPLKVNGANFSTLLPPGVQLLPHFEVWSYRACQPLQMWQNFTFLWNPLWATRRQIFFAMLSQWGKFGTLLPPRGATFTPFWGMVLQSLPASWNVANFTFLWNPLSELRGVKVFSMLSQCVWFCPYFAPGANIVPPIAYKSHSTRFPIRPHVWHLIGLCDKNCGRSSAPKKVEEEYNKYEQ